MRIQSFAYGKEEGDLGGRRRNRKDRRSEQPRKPHRGAGVRDCPQGERRAVAPLLRREPRQVESPPGTGGQEGTAPAREAAENSSEERQGNEVNDGGITKDDLKQALDCVVEVILTDMGVRFRRGQSASGPDRRNAHNARQATRCGSAGDGRSPRVGVKSRSGLCARAGRGESTVWISSKGSNDFVFLSVTVPVLLALFCAPAEEFEIRPHRAVTLTAFTEFSNASKETQGNKSPSMNGWQALTQSLELLSVNVDAMQEAQRKYEESQRRTEERERRLARGADARDHRIPASTPERSAVIARA